MEGQGDSGRAPTDGYEAMAPFLYIRFCFTCNIFGPGFMYNTSQILLIESNSPLLVTVQQFMSAQLYSLPKSLHFHVWPIFHINVKNHALVHVNVF